MPQSAVAPADTPALIGQIENGVKLWSAGGLNSPLLQPRPGGRRRDGKTARHAGVAQAWEVRSDAVRAHQQLEDLINVLPLLKVLLFFVILDYGGAALPKDLRGWEI